MRYLIASIFLLLSVQARAEFVELQDMFINWSRLKSGSRNYLIDSGKFDGREPDQRLSLGFNLSLAGNFYWNNEIISYTARHVDNQRPEQFRTVAWKFEVGLRVFKFLDVEYRHMSQHLLDAGSEQRYPVEDAVGVQFNIYRKNDKNSLIDLN